MHDTLSLIPDSLVTSKSVRQSMLSDTCTWDTDYHRNVINTIRRKILDLANLDAEEYSVILMQGSGTFSLEAAIASSIKFMDKLLIVSNGTYGKRLECIAGYKGLPHILINLHETEPVTGALIRQKLDQHPDITHLALVHCETTSGILNPLEEIAPIVKGRGITLIIDAMGSFGGIPYDIKKCGVDFLVCNSSKCLQGTPGLGFVIAKRDKLKDCRGVSPSFSLDLYDQWMEMENFEGRWRFTSPTHIVKAFLQAIVELEEEGGITARYERYRKNQDILVQGMKNIGFQPLLTTDLMAPIVSTFMYPENDFDFSCFQSELKKRGYTIYVGQIPDVRTFRIATFGNIFPEDFTKMLGEVESVVKANNLFQK